MGKYIHDKCALIVLVSKECLIIDSLGTSEFLIYVHNLLLEVIQTVPMSHDVVSDVPFEALNARHAALEKGTKNEEFLRNIHINMPAVKKLEVMTHCRGHHIRILVEVEAERSPDVS